MDVQHGFPLEVLELASVQATAVALQAGEVDIIVSDWLWVSRQRAEGKRYTFVPFSSSVGSVMVQPDSPIRDLADIKGTKIGVVGGPHEQNWPLMRRFRERRPGFHTAIASPAVSSATPMQTPQGETGQYDGGRRIRTPHA